MKKNKAKNKKEKIYIYGKHAVREALTHSPGAIKKVFFLPGAEEDLLDLVQEKGIETGEISEKASLPTDKRGTHQGVFAQLSIERLVRSYDDFIQDLEIGPDTALVLLDELQDPHNVGAVIRSAAAFGISGILLPEHNQAPITGAVVKVSAGMAFRVPIVAIGNVNNTLRDLKKKGFWTYGLSGEAEKSVTEEDFSEPSVFILGNESKGIREKTFELCDIPLSIPMNPRCESLNVAAAAAVSFYAWSVRHPGALG